MVRVAAIPPALEKQNGAVEQRARTDPPPTETREFSEGDTRPEKIAFLSFLLQSSKTESKEMAILAPPRSKSGTKSSQQPSTILGPHSSHGSSQTCWA